VEEMKRKFQYENHFILESNLRDDVLRSVAEIVAVKRGRVQSNFVDKHMSCTHNLLCILQKNKQNHYRTAIKIRLKI